MENDIQNELLQKIIGMFRPYNGERFLGFDGKTVICVPNDRAFVGFDNNFPIEWLIEDYGFTEELAKTFVRLVQENSRKEKTNACRSGT